jgi:apolipoprotein N-acyltransferase
LTARPLRLFQLLLAAGAGALQALSLAWPGNGQPQWWLQIVSLAVLAGLLQGERRWRPAAVTAWVFATCWLTATFWWLFISMHVYGGLASPLAALAVLLLAAFLALDYALAGALFALAPRRPWSDGLLFAALWMGAELLRGTLYTGFPWGAGGYAHTDGPLAPLASWIGVYGIGAAAAWLAWLLSLLVQRPARGSWRYWLTVVAAAGLLAACNAQHAAERPHSAGGARLKVALLQGNIPQDEKFQGGSGIPLALEWYGRMLRDADAQLVVAPETAIPLLPPDLPEGYLDALRASFGHGTRAALVGIPLGDYREGYTNSVLGFKGDKTEYRYDKHHLVPFGEFIPPLFKWFTRMMNIPLGDFNRGNVGQASFEWAGQRLAPNVCYEDLFGEELAARFRDPARAPTIFVNVSNIAWFGDSIAIDQHLQISRMRALEFERPMIRATNTGPTVIIDRFGRVTQALPRLTRGVLVGEVEGGTAFTPYARWVAALGLAPLWIAAALAALACLWRPRGRPPLGTT